jgi:hypothetical protein
LHAAALPAPSKVALPEVKPAGIDTAAIGLSAAMTALNAFTMPAPQVLVVQAHSTLEEDPATHCGVGGFVTGCGNGVALALMRAMICGGVRFAFAARINAAIPVTMGAEKLVPRLEFVWSVYELIPGTVAPSFVVVSMDRRQGLPRFTQLPAGAAIPTSGPKLL